MTKTTDRDIDALFEIIDEWECSHERACPHVDCMNNVSLHILHPDFLGLMDGLLPFNPHAGNVGGNMWRTTEIGQWCDKWIDMFVVVDRTTFARCHNDEDGSFIEELILPHTPQRAVILPPLEDRIAVLESFVDAMEGTDLRELC